MNPARRVAALAVLSCAVMIGMPAAALATPGWSAPQSLGLSSGVSAPQIAYASGGIATVAYVQITSQAPVATALHIGVVPVGGSYVDQLTIPSTANALPAAVSLSETPDGAAVIEYETISSTAANANVATYALVRAAGSDAWGSPATITPPAQRDSVHPTQMVTAIALDGSSAAGIERTDSTDASPGGDRIDVAVANRGGTWGNPTEISLSGEDNESFALAFDTSDNLTAAFTSATPAATERPTAEVATRSGTTGAWGAPVMVSAVSPTDFLGSPLQLGVAPDGSAVIAYQLLTASHTLDTWATTRSGANGGWTVPADVTPGSVSTDPGAVGVSPSDMAYVIYAYQGTTTKLDCVGAVRANVGGSFSAPACVSAQNYEPRGIAGVGFLGNDAYFAFTGEPNGGSDYDLEGDRWTDGAGAPDAPTTIVSPQPAMPLLLAVEPDEDGGLPIIFSLDITAAIEASAWDAAGPNLVSSAVPATAIAGQSISLEATFADLWSGPLTSPSWSFGDGVSANGVGVSHTYATPGTYVATVSSVDSLGNTTTKTFAITVTAAASPVAATTTPIQLELTAVSQTHASWLEKKPAHRNGRQPAVGTAFHFTLNTAAAVTVTFNGSRSGRKLGKKCVAGASSTKHPRCSLHISDVLTIGGHSGLNTLNFIGAVRGHAKLAAGKYTVTFSAGSGGLKSSTSRLHFVILRS